MLQAAIRYQIDPDLLAAIMQQESGGEPAAVGAWAWIPHMGRYERAIGLMQVMPNEAERRGVSSTKPGTTTRTFSWARACCAIS